MIRTDECDHAGDIRRWRDEARGALEALAQASSGTGADLGPVTLRLRRLAEDLDAGLRSAGGACDESWEPPALGVEGPMIFKGSELEKR